MRIEEFAKNPCRKKKKHMSSTEHYNQLPVAEIRITHSNAQKTIVKKFSSVRLPNTGQESRQAARRQTISVIQNTTNCSDIVEVKRSDVDVHSEVRQKGRNNFGKK